MASAGSRVVRMSGRPMPARRTGPASVIVGTPRTTAWSTALSRSTRSRIGVSGGVPAGTRSGISAAVPVDSRVTTISPSSRASPSTAIRSSAPDDLERDEPAIGLERHPGIAVAPLERAAPEHERAAALVLPRLLGIEPAAHAHVAGLAGGRELDGTPHLHQRRRGEDPSDPRPRAHGAQQPPAGAERDDTRQDEEQGDHPAMIAAVGRATARQGNGGCRRNARESVARRNLLDAWALR